MDNTMFQCDLVQIGTHEFNRIVTMLQAEGLPVDDLNDPAVSLFSCAKKQVICGGVGLDPFGDIALLRSLVVAPACRGQGLGHKLAAFAEAEAQSRSLKALYILTESADRFFTHRGYKTISRADAPISIQNSSQFSALCPSSARLMRLDLS